MAYEDITSHRVDLHLSWPQEDALVAYATARGFQREHPRRNWTKAERKRAVIFATLKLVHDQAPRTLK